MSKTCQSCRFASPDSRGIWCFAEKRPKEVYPAGTCEDWEPDITEYERGEWEMFELITSVWYGKSCYFLQDDPAIVYSRISGKHMKRDKAYLEFLDQIGDDGDY